MNQSIITKEIQPSAPDWKSYVINAIIGGLVVILPLALLVFAMRFILGAATTLLKPLTNLMGFSPEDRGIVVGAISGLLLLAFLSAIGIAVKSHRGKRNFRFLEQKYLHKIPFYSTLRDSVEAFVERDNTLFSDVVLIDCYGTGVTMTGFVTDEHASGIVTVFVPTAPNPANGVVYHVPKHLVTYLDCSVESTMRTIVGVGVGSAELFDLQRLKEEQKERILA